MPARPLTKPTRVRINPSRSTCEEIIRRILTTENRENGANCHFKTAMDFMSYFESLYPASPALTKQVQRAIKSLDLGKDENGYFLINKTKEEQSRERELSSILQRADAALPDSAPLEAVFLRAAAPYRSYLAALLSESTRLRPLFLTMMETVDGILFLTEDPKPLRENLQELLS